MDHLRNKVEHWKAEAGVAQDQQQHMARQLNVRQRAYDDLVPQLAAKQRFLDAAEEQLVSSQPLSHVQVVYTHAFCNVLQSWLQWEGQVDHVCCQSPV